MGRKRKIRRTRSKRPKSRGDRPPLWFGAIFLLAGGFIAAIGAGFIPVEPESVHAPGWVIIACGLVFAMGGVMCYTESLGDNVNSLFACVLLVAFASVFSWVAFGPGEREFTGSGSIGPIAVVERVGETMGRIAFGFGAIMIWTITAAVAVRWFRSLVS